MRVRVRVYAHPWLLLIQYSCVSEIHHGGREHFEVDEVIQYFDEKFFGDFGSFVLESSLLLHLGTIQAQRMVVQQLLVQIGVQRRIRHTVITTNLQKEL